MFDQSRKISHTRPSRCLMKDIREVKHDVYGKRQTAKIKLLVSDFSRLYNLSNEIELFSYFLTGFI